MENNRLSPPKAGVGDRTHRGVKAAIAAIPYLGGPAAEFFDEIVKPPLTKRLEEWRETVAEGVTKLEAKVEGFSIGSLKENPSFISAVMHATQVAIRAHQNEKREALRNAVLNVASGNEADEDLVLMFLNFIDTFTPPHLRLLTAFKNSSSVPVSNFPAIQEDRSMFDQIVKDLYDRGLIGMPVHLVARGPQDLYEVNKGRLEFAQGRITSLGKRFIKFISSPVQ